VIENMVELVGIEPTTFLAVLLAQLDLGSATSRSFPLRAYWSRTRLRSGGSNSAVDVLRPGSLASAFAPTTSAGVDSPIRPRVGPNEKIERGQIKLTEPRDSSWLADRRTVCGSSSFGGCISSCGYSERTTVVQEKSHAA
jgi:hypothetical protein